MPEFVELEAFRLTAAPLEGSTIDSIAVRDERMLRRGDDVDELHAAGIGVEIASVRRTGKVLFLDLDNDHSFALTFGLRGRLVLDGQASRVDGSARAVSPADEHIRLELWAGAQLLQLEDQLRLATIELDMDEEALGVDILDLDKTTFVELLSESRAAVKSRLMDQGVIAGIGNLIADEILYQGKVDPRRQSAELTQDEVDTLWDGLRRTRTRVLERGGSHQGVLIQSGARERGEACPRCGVEISRTKVGGRTSYFCPEHQT